MKKHLFYIVVVLGIIMLGLNGCASKEFVNQQISQSLGTEISKVRQDIQANQNEIREFKESIATVSSTAQDALNRAESAGKLAEGKFLYEATISDASVNFAFDKSNLSDEGRAALDVIAEVVKNENRNVYIEIQGHTDSLGSEKYNLKLGHHRAKNVLRYFYSEHNLPLHRMDIFSYGESQPVVDNDNKDNRAKNRRVVIVVMK